MATAHVVNVGGMRLGEPSRFALIAGPCSIESREQFREIATAVKSQGACVLRGGIFKLRTSPDTFQGLGSSAYEMVREVKTAAGLPFVSEITDPREIESMIDVVDMFQVGARNMYNYSLLTELGRLRVPVMLKRGFSALVDEWLKAADYIARGGNDQIVLCERGIRTFETVTRNTLDLNAVAYLKTHSHWPVIVDPSHGTGRPDLIPHMSRAAVAVGADGIMVEVHPRPSQAKSDGFQALNFSDLESLATSLQPLLLAMGKKFVGPERVSFGAGSPLPGTGTMS